MKKYSSLIPLVLKEYSETGNIQATARKFNLDKKTVKFWLVKNDIPIREVFDDLLGNQYGRLTIVSYLGKDIHHKSLWNCSCECGKTTKVRANDLKMLKTSSCGCLKKEVSSHLGSIAIKKINKQNKAVGNLSGVHYTQIRTNAATRNFEFAVTKEYLWDLFLKQEKKCAITGVKLEMFIETEKRGQTTASLDRIDSSLGYTNNNVQWVHRDINIMKWNFSLDKLTNWCKLVIEHQNSLKP